MSPRMHFAQELIDLRKDMMYMGREVQRLVEMTLDVIINNNLTKAEEVIDQGGEIDRLEVEIQQQCVIMIARQQPMAKDLRLIMSVIKIVTDMERIGDQCQDICKYCLRLQGTTYTESEAFKRHVNKMALGVNTMMNNVLQSYYEKDVEVMQQVCDYDDTIDARFSQIWQEIIEEMLKDEDFIHVGPHFIMIIKYLERIADHITNIAEWMIYNITGDFA